MLDDGTHFTHEASKVAKTSSKHQPGSAKHQPLRISRPCKMIEGTVVKFEARLCFADLS